MLQATGQTDAERAALGRRATDGGSSTRELAPHVAPFRAMFGGRPGEPEDGFAATLDQTLFLKHGADGPRADSRRGPATSPTGSRS